MLLPVPDGCFRCESGSRLIFISNKPGKIKLSKVVDELTTGTNLSSPATYYFICYGENKKYQKVKIKSFIEGFEISLGTN